MTTLSEIPEGKTFAIANPYIMGGGEHYDRGGCKLTLVPDQIYTVSQSLAGFIVAEGICRLEQMPSVDRMENTSFTVDADLTVTPLP
jgi:hypothetical protein